MKGSPRPVSCGCRDRSVTVSKAVFGGRGINPSAPSVLCPERLEKQGFFAPYCVTRARIFRIRSAACLRVMRFRQSGQYFTLLDVDAKSAPHSVHRRLSPVW